MNLQNSESGQPKNARLAAVQMVSTPRVGENLETAGRLIAEAVAQGAEVVALPEYFPVMGLRDGDKFAVSEADGHGPIQDFLAQTAYRHGIWLVGGSLPLMASVPDKVLNSSLVYNPGGEREVRYDKIHLFGFQKGGERYNEGATIEAGSQPLAFTAPFGRVGLSICYDMRFPELYRMLGVVDLLVIPAAFTETTGRAHWEILLRARAIEADAANIGTPTDVGGFSMNALHVPAGADAEVPPIVFVRTRSPMAKTGGWVAGRL